MNSSSKNNSQVASGILAPQAAFCIICIDNDSKRPSISLQLADLMVNEAAE
jgi:hypothetical protein